MQFREYAIPDNASAPRYRPGERVSTDTTCTPEIGNEVVVVLHDAPVRIGWLAHADADSIGLILGDLAGSLIATPREYVKSVEMIACHIYAKH